MTPAELADIRLPQERELGVRVLERRTSKR